MSLILLTLPLITALILWFSPVSETGSYKELKHSLFKKALILTLLNLFHSLLMLHFYDPNVTNFQFKLVIGNQLIGGIDGISLWLIILVNLIIPIVILNSWKVIGKKDIKLFKNFLI